MQYPKIDMIQTGLTIKHYIKQAGYTVKQIQEYLHLSCPQPIYRWFKGQVLPSIDNIYALSKLLRVPMEKLIVEQSEMENSLFDYEVYKPSNQRLWAYYQMLCKAA